MFGRVFPCDLIHSLASLPQTYPENLCLLSMPYLVSHHCAVLQTKLSGHSGEFQVDSKTRARNHNSFTCLESSYPVIRVTWPIVR